MHGTSGGEDRLDSTHCSSNRLQRALASAPSIDLYCGLRNLHLSNGVYTYSWLQLSVMMPALVSIEYVYEVNYISNWSPAIIRRSYRFCFKFLNRLNTARS